MTTEPPIHCPRCDQPLPSETSGDMPTTVSAATLMSRRYPESATIRYDSASRAVLIFGGDSRYLEDQPYAITADRVTSPEEVAGWICHLWSKGWVMDEYALGKALLAALRETDRSIVPDRIFD